MFPFTREKWRNIASKNHKSCGGGDCYWKWSANFEAVFKANTYGIVTFETSDWGTNANCLEATPRLFTWIKSVIPRVVNLVWIYGMIHLIYAFAQSGSRNVCYATESEHAKMLEITFILFYTSPSQ